MVKLPVVLVAAMAGNGVIGHENRLIWRLRSDMRRFRELTMGCPMVMGRKTFLSIGKPLPGRQTIVMTRDAGFHAEGVEVAHSLTQALDKAQEIGARTGAGAVIVAGGADVYAQAIPLVDRLELTEVAAEPEGDARFPLWDASGFELAAREEHPSGPEDEYPFAFLSYRRKV